MQTETRRTTLLTLGSLAVGGALLLMTRSHAEAAREIPLPAMDQPAGDAQTEVAVLAGGCFWGVQGVFQHVNGVVGAVSGYAGGAQNTAEYETVSTGRTGHAESVRITFDPRRISFGRILQIFFSAAHDPTELNRQGPDIGTQYRSAIFPTSAKQAAIARAYIAQLDKAHAFPGRIVTVIESDRVFYPAEDYHQDYMTRNPGSPYIAMYDLPKVRELQRIFPDMYRADPVLVAAVSRR